MAITSGSMVVGRVGNPFFFTGRRLDVFDKQDAGTPHHFTDDHAGLQLYDYRARTMDPVLGRFGQRDPIGYHDGINLYEYVMSAPSLFTDPTGTEIPPCGYPPRPPCDPQPTEPGHFLGNYIRCKGDVTLTGKQADELMSGSIGVQVAMGNRGQSPISEVGSEENRGERTQRRELNRKTTGAGDSGLGSRERRNDKRRGAEAKRGESNLTVFLRLLRPLRRLR